MRRSRDDRKAAIHGEGERARREDGDYSDRPSFIVGQDELKKLGLSRYQIDSGENGKAKTHRWSFLEPHPDDPCLIGMPVYVHWSVGPDGGTQLCPRFMLRELKRLHLPVPDAIKDGRCPICEESDRQVDIYKRKKDNLTEDERKAEYKKIRELNPYNGSFTDPKPNRVVSFILDEKDLDSGLQVVDMPRAIYLGLIKQADDPDTGETVDVLDPTDKGVVFSFEREGKGREGVKYGAFKLAPRREHLEQADLDAVPRFMDVLVFVGYDDLKAMFSAAPADADRKGGGAEAAEPEPTGRTRGRSTAEAVSDETGDEIAEHFEQDSRRERRRRGGDEPNPTTEDAARNTSRSRGEQPASDGEPDDDVKQLADKIRNRPQAGATAGRQDTAEGEQQNGTERPRRRRHVE